MGYYIRVLSTSSECVPLAKLKKALYTFQATLSVEVGEEVAWEQLILSHADGREIACIERNLVTDSSLAAEELDEFREEIAGGKPSSAVTWLSHYFSRVRCIYASQLLSGTDHLNGWDIFGALKDVLWGFAPSIIQADREGFSNEDGYHILWQFSDDVKGPWWMGVLRDGEWQHFQMELGNRRQREAFFRGEIPAGAKRA
jgi:hypothetical protein